MIIDKNFLDEKSKLFIEEVVLGDYFPFYIQKNTTDQDVVSNNFFLSHRVVARPEENSESVSIITSDFHQEFFKIFELFTNKNNIQHNQIHRCSVNLTFKVNAIACPIHNDHDFEHKQLLIYLNDCDDKESKTVLLDKKAKSIIEEIPPEQYKGVCFDSCPHFHYFPKKGKRVVLVYTFS